MPPSISHDALLPFVFRTAKSTYLACYYFATGTNKVMLSSSFVHLHSHAVFHSLFFEAFSFDFLTQYDVLDTGDDLFNYYSYYC